MKSITYTLRREGYKRGAPSFNAAEIDGEVANRATCPKCGGACYYNAWHKPGSYRAFIVCRQCGYRQEF